MTLDRRRRGPTVLPPRVLLAILFVIALNITGIAGFMLVEHLPPLDAFFMAVSTISTVGFSAPRPLDNPGKLLAVGLIFGGIFATAFVISTITEYFVEGTLLGALEHRRMNRSIEQLDNHFIVTGYGRVGQEVARAMSREGIPFVVVDLNRQALAVAEADGFLVVEGDASQDEILHAAGADRAKGLIACADSDMNNVYVTLSARSSNPRLYIIARAAYADAMPKLVKAGADRVVSPYVIAGRHMAHMASDRQLADYMDLILEGSQLDLQITEVHVSPASGMAGQTIEQLYRSVLAGTLLVAIDRGGQQLARMPLDTVVQLEDRLILATSGEQAVRLATIE